MHNHHSRLLTGVLLAVLGCAPPTGPGELARFVLDRADDGQLPVIIESPTVPSDPTTVHLIWGAINLRNDGTVLWSRRHLTTWPDDPDKQAVLSEQVFSGWYAVGGHDIVMEFLVEPGGWPRTLRVTGTLWTDDVELLVPPTTPDGKTRREGYIRVR